jgi:hypothetical protein
MTRIVPIAAGLEGLTGLALVAMPALVAQLLLGIALEPGGLVVARVAGIALIGLALASLPSTQRLGMIAYSTVIAAYLAWLGVAGGIGGPLLWPAVAAHVAMSVVLIKRSYRGMS